MSSKRRPTSPTERLSAGQRTQAPGSGGGRVRASSPLRPGQAAVSGSTASLGSTTPGTGAVTVRDAGTDIGTRPAINLIEGSNVTLTIADDAASGEVDVTIAAAGGGSSDGCYVPLGDGDTSDPGYLFAPDADPIYVTCAAAGL